jgi:hypothetical protein
LEAEGFIPSPMFVGSPNILECRSLKKPERREAEMNDFLSQTDFARLYSDSTSHGFGRWLIEIGLRTRAKQPSQEAIDGGFCKLIKTGRGTGFFYIWHVEKTAAALERAGHRRKDRGPASQPTAKLAGPFEARLNGESSYEIVDTNGSVGIWASGTTNAQNLVKLLNVASDHDVFF